MVVDGNGELLFGYLLPNDVQVEKFLDFLGLGKFFSNGRGYDVIRNDFIAYIDALIAYVNGGSGNELFYVVLALGAE
jgi:hypothetical protein